MYFLRIGCVALTPLEGAARIAAMNISPEVISLIDEVKNDKTHGASQLARQAISVLKVTAEHSRSDSSEQFLSEQKLVGERLMSARPAMAPIYNIVSRFLDAISEVSADVGLDSIRSLVYGV